MPLGEYLIGRPGTKAGSYPRYYPGDWTSLDCRKKIQVQRQCSKNIPTNIVTPRNQTGERVVCHGTKLTNSLGKQQLEHATRK